MTYFKGTVKVGNYDKGARIPDYFRASIHKALQGISDDTYVEFVIQPRKRSIKQNGFYWDTAVHLVQSMFREKGQPLSASETHEIIFGVIMGQTKTVTMPNGERQEIRRSSTELTTAEWEDAMTLLRAWCAKEGKTLAFPNEGEYETITTESHK